METFVVFIIIALSSSVAYGYYNVLTSRQLKLLARPFTRIKTHHLHGSKYVVLSLRLDRFNTLRKLGDDTLTELLSNLQGANFDLQRNLDTLRVDVSALETQSETLRADVSALETQSSILDTALIAATTPQCRTTETVVEIENKCYGLYEGPLEQNDAINACVILGSILAEPSADIITDPANFLNIITSDPNFQAVVTAINDAGTTGVFLGTHAYGNPVKVVYIQSRFILDVPATLLSQDPVQLDYPAGNALTTTPLDTTALPYICEFPFH